MLCSMYTASDMFTKLAWTVAGIDFAWKQLNFNFLRLKSKGACHLAVWARAKSMMLGWRSFDCRPKQRVTSLWNRVSSVDCLNTVTTKRNSLAFLVSDRHDVYLSGRVCPILTRRETHGDVANTTPSRLCNVSTAVAPQAAQHYVRLFCFRRHRNNTW